MFEPIARQSASGAVFDQISAKVLHGDLAPGAPLPSERDLAAAFGVSRPAVREAIGKLSQAGLVEVRQGDATSVRDFRRHAGPELLGPLLIRDGLPDWSVVRSVLEARALIGAQVAALAADRATAELDDALAAAAAALGAESDPLALQQLALDYWDLVVDGADSIAFRLIFNSLRKAYEPAMAAVAVVMVAEVGRADLYQALAAAITARDAAAAQDRAAALLARGTAALLAVADTLEDPR